MKATTAIMTFMNTKGYERVSVKEMKEFKDFCSPLEFQKYGKQACEALEEDFTES